MADAPSKPPSTISRMRHAAGLAIQAASDLRRWAMTSRLRASLVAGGALTLLALMVLVWTLLAERIVDGEQRLSTADALQALDAEEFDTARQIVKRMLQHPALPPKDYGGPPFVLGVLQAREAEKEPLGEQRREAYLIASTYLQEAARRGFPPGREPQGLLTLGKCLTKARKYEQAQPVLERALKENPQHSTQLHRLLVAAYRYAREPDYPAAKRHSTAELADRTLPPHVRADALLRRGEILLEMNQIDELASLVEELPEELHARPVAQMLRARLQIAEAEPLQEEVDADPSTDPAPLLQSAIATLRNVQAAARQDSELARAAMYLVGECYARLPGEVEAALEQYSRVRKLYSGTAEGVAASIAEAKLLLQSGQTEEAVTAYQRTLRAAGDPRDYHNPWLPLASLKKQVLAALDSLLHAREFDAAIKLVDAFSPAIDNITILLQRAHIYRAWGEAYLDEAELQEGESAAQARRRGRARFRRAAIVYEELSEVRLTQPEYADDLWQAIELSMSGRSYSGAVRLLETYLAREAVVRRPQALVKLGEAHLAVGDLDRAIAAFEECIELYNRDASIYAARLHCAQAYREKGDSAKAAELLRTNLTEQGLTPRSREWRESLLQLGKLDYAEGRYLEAIQSLREYVQRYDQHESQGLLARYLVAQSYRQAARDPLEKLQTAVTENERLKHRARVEELSQAALDHFSEVQRMLTLKGADTSLDPLEEALLRNCYFFRPDVLFSLRDYERALEMYRNASSLYQNDPVALDAYLQIASCHRRLGQLQEARGAIEQAKIVLSRLPPDADFTVASSFGREQWGRVLNEMSQW